VLIFMEQFKTLMSLCLIGKIQKGGLTMLLKRMLLIVLMVMLIPVAAFAADWNDYWVSGWHDEISGYDVYNLSPGNEKVTEQTVLLHRPDQEEWLRLEEIIQSLWRPYEDHSFPGAWVREKGKRFNPYESYHYDILNNRLILGKQYEISPNEKWGIQYNDYFGDHGRIKSYLLKNMEDGSITECFTTNQSTWYYWLPDSTVLFCTFSTEEKQNVIYIFDPETKKIEKLVSGSLRAYDRDRNKILFVKNEPMRKSWVMDLSTGTEVQEDNVDSFYPSFDTGKVPLPPLDLDLNSIKVILPERITQYEHEMQIGEEAINLPFVFEKDNREYIPLRPLMDPLGIKVNIKQLDYQTREYQVSYQENKFTLSGDEFINYRWQLFVTPDVLKKLGLREFTVRAVTD
jgi:hypothetical protein